MLRRSRQDIPIHLDYKEQDSSDKEESSDDESEVEVIKIDDDKEHSTPAQKRDAVSAGLSESSVSKTTNKRIKLSSSTGSPIEEGASQSDQINNQFFEDVMEDLMKKM